MNDKMEAPPPPTKRQKMDQNEDCKLKEAMSDHVEDLIERNKSSKDIDTNSFVTDDDLQKLREFKVLDEVKCNEEDSNDEDSNSSDDDKSVGLPEEEIEKMLEENLPDGFKTAPKPKEKTYTTRTKIVLEEKVINQFEVLPLDWMVVTHHSGMPIYIHKTTRVCSLSKPYFLGKGNIRRHDIPLSAIPCLAYKRALEEEEKQKEIDRQVNEQIKNLNQTAGEASKTCPVNKNSLLDKFVKNKQSGFTPNISLSTNTQSKCSFNQLDKVNTDDSQNVENNEGMEVDNSAISNKMEIEANKVCEIANEFSTLDFANDSIIHEEVANKNYTTSDGQNDIKTYLSNENNEKLQIVENLETTTNKKLGAETTAVEINEKSDLKEDKPQNSTLFENVETITNKELSAETSAVEINEKSDLKEDESQNSTLLNRRSVILPNGEIMPAPRVESVNNNWKTQNLTPEQLNNYCKSLFIFKTINIMQFNRWADRRKYARAKKAMQYPTLPEGTKLITIPVQNSGQDSGGKGAKRDWVMNMNGGSYLSVFHEYVCRALHKQPVYEYRQIENATTPYQASVYIGGMQYGVGLGSSKRQAKYAAARASIQILIPEMREYMDAPVADQHAKPDFSFFDYMAIEDPRIPEFCAASCEPSPHAILRTCLLRNFGTSDRHIHTEMKKIACLEIEMTMTVGKHSATVVCKNKKTAKQRASQAILQALHPHVRSWGSLLRLYGSKSVKSCKEKKLEEQQITLLQDKARRNEPNHAVLEKLRNEMRKLRERDQSVVPIGTLLLTEDLPTHSGSNLNNVDM